jgi:hypothetical protein
MLERFHILGMILLLLIVPICQDAISQNAPHTPASQDIQKSSAVAGSHQDAQTQHNECQKNNSEYEMFFGRCYKVTDFFLVIFTGLLCLVTGGLIYVGVRQEFHLRDTARKELRAYVALNTISHDRAAGPLRIRIQNYGKTPAHHVSVVQFVFAEAQVSSYKHPATNSDDTLANQMLHPGQSFNHDVSAGASNPTIEASLGNGRVIYVYGRIDYMDIYKRWWVTYFCEIYNPGLPEDRRCSPHAYHNYEYPLA